MGKSDKNSHTVVKRALNIMKILTENEHIGVTELANELCIPKTTAHSYLKTLENTGYAINKSGRYRLSFQVLQTAGKLRHKTPLYQAGRREVDKLSRKIEEAVNLGIDEKGERILIYTAEGENAVWDDTPVGSRTPLNLTAIGKAILAFQSNQYVDEFLKSGNLVGTTEKSITSPEKLEDDLKVIRDRGYSIENNEHIVGVRAFGVPILTDNREVVGAISITGPDSRLRSEKVEQEFTELLKERSNVIELKLERY